MEDKEQDLPSKTQLKKEAEKLQDLGSALAKLPISVLETFELPDNLLGAIKTLKSIKQNRALKRQLQFIGKLMRQIESDDIQKSYDNYFSQINQGAKQFHQVEEWRDKFINNDRSVFDDFLQKYSSVDRQHLRQLQRNAIKENEQKKSPKVARQLFKYIRDTIDAHDQESSE